MKKIPDFDENSRRDHENVIEGYQIGHGHRHRWEQGGEEAAAGQRDVHDEHAGSDGAQQSEQRWPQMGQIVHDQYEAQRLEQDEGELE